MHKAAVKVVAYCVSATIVMTMIPGVAHASEMDREVTSVGQTLEQPYTTAFSDASDILGISTIVNNCR